MKTWQAFLAAVSKDGKLASSAKVWLYSERSDASMSESPVAPRCTEAAQTEGDEDKIDREAAQLGRLLLLRD